MTRDSLSPVRTLDPDLDLDIGLRDDPELPPSDGDKFCHIEGADGKAYCGHRSSTDGRCGAYKGEAICQTCGLPTCPSCAVRSSLNAQLVEDSE